MIERIYTDTHGPIPYLEGGSGPVLLFLHGAFAMPHAYEPLLNLLAEHYHVIAPTHPGHGRSFSINSLWSYDDYVFTYTQFIASLSDAPEVFVGHSFGGALSFSLARNIPHAKIIAMDTAGLPFPFIVKDFISALIHEGEGALKKDPDMDTIKELVIAAKTLAVTITQHPENIPWFYRHGPTLDLSETIRSLTNPIALLWGEHDAIVPFSVAARMRELAPQTILTTYVGLEHDYAVTQPEFTHKQIRMILSYLSIAPR